MASASLTASEPVVLPAIPPPAAEETPPASEPELAVVVDRDSDRKTPIVEISPVIDAEPDPFPKFEPEPEPETQPEESGEDVAEPADGKTMVGGVEPPNDTKDETPDAKKTSSKKKKSGK